MWQQVAHSAMKAVVEDLHETAHLAILDGNEAVHIHQVETNNQLVRTHGRVGDSVPLHSTCLGHVLLAWLPEEQALELVGPEPYEAHTGTTVITSDGLRKRLAAVRENGFVMVDGEMEDGMRSLAVPVRDADGTVVASLSVSGPAGRMADGRVPTIRQRLQAAADSIGANLS